MKKIILFLVLSFYFSSCEKDDICSDETTPRLIIEFYDVGNPANLKNVLNLKVRGVVESGSIEPDFIIFNSATNDSKYLFNGNKLELPLRTDGNTTKYRLILNSNGTVVPSNEDFLEFNYTPQNVYVSRACGYKTTYTLDDAPNGVVKTNAPLPDTFWIQDINIQTNTISTENETHIKILF